MAKKKKRHGNAVKIKIFSLSIKNEITMFQYKLNKINFTP